MSKLAWRVVRYLVDGYEAQDYATEAEARDALRRANRKPHYGCDLKHGGDVVAHILGR